MRDTYDFSFLSLIAEEYNTPNRPIIGNTSKQKIKTKSSNKNQKSKIEKLISIAFNNEFQNIDNEAAKLIYILKFFGKRDSGELITENNIFGNKEYPTSLYINDISQQIKISDFDKERGYINIKISDIAMLMPAISNICNGITSLRTLQKLGVVYDKTNNGECIDFFGIEAKNSENDYSRIPSSVRKHFRDLFKINGQNCGGCPCVLQGDSFSSKKNYEIDHIFAPNYKLYNIDKQFRDNVENYQLLCKTCNATKREMDKI